MTARRSWAGVVLALSLAVAGRGSDGDDPVELSGTSWTLVRESLGVPVPDAVAVTISFSDDAVSGRSGCNNFAGSYTVDGTGLVMGPLATTRKACVPDIAIVEDAVLTRLAVAVSIAVDVDELRLFDTDNAVVLRFRPAS